MKFLLPLALLTVMISSVSAQERKIEFSTVQLSDTVYMLGGNGGNVGISTGEDGLYIIDDKVEPVSTQLLQAIRKISDKPIRFVINTHYHFDHVGGNEMIGKTGSTIISHDNIRQRMTSVQVNNFLERTFQPSAEPALPVLTFIDRMSLHFNGESATVYHVPNGHTDGDSIIYFSGSNVIHMGDMYFNTMYPYVDLDAGGSIEGVIAAADLALSLADEGTRIIPGHGPLAVLEDLKFYRDYLVEATANVQVLIDEGMNLGQVIAAQPTAQWDEELGRTWITPPQFVNFIYSSLEDIHRYTPEPAEAVATD